MIYTIHKILVSLKVSRITLMIVFSSSLRSIIDFIIEYNNNLNKIRPYFKDINNLKKSDTWKIQLTIAINFISSEDNDKERVMQSKSKNIQFMICTNADKVIENLNHFLTDIKLDWKHQ